MKPRNCEHKPSKPNFFLIAVGLVLLVLPIVLFLIDPLFLIIQYMSRISNGSRLFDLMNQNLTGAYLYVYIFNVTNTEAFLSGDDHKLKLQEIGPYTYQERRINKDFELDEEEGVMRYYPLSTAEFQPDESIGDPRMVNVTVPNVAMLGAASMFSSYSFFTRSGFNLLAAQLKSQPIISLDLHSFLWGYEEPLISFGNSLIPGLITFNKLGILDRLYDPTTVPRLEVVSEGKDKFSIKTADGSPGLKARQYHNLRKRTHCNTFVDTYEGIAFPLGLSSERPLRLYRNIFCRMIDLEFIGTRALDYDPRAFVYKFRNDTFSTNTETDCLCGDYDCVDGVSNISPCLYGLGVGFSNAHFLHSNPKIYERIDGMYPDEKKHGSEIVVDPITGVVLETNFTLQVNIIIKDVTFNSATKAFSDMVVPLCFIKVVQPRTTEEIKYNLKLIHFVLPYVSYGLEIVIFLIGLMILVYSSTCIYWVMLFKNEIRFEISNSKQKVSIPSETPLVERPQNVEVVKYHLDFNHDIFIRANQKL